jgi:aconitate hydratase
VPGYVKTSLAPGSRVVSRYLETSGLLPYLEKLGFGVVGYGCTTCIGNSGPLPEEVSRAVAQGELVVAAVLSGNRNFEARIHGEVRANYLASPPLVVAFALAGSMTHDLLHDPLGKDARGHPIYFRDIWPSDGEIKEAVRQSLDPAVFRELYGGIETQSPLWNALPAPEGETFAWSPKSTYIRKPPFFEGFRAREVPGIKPIRDARALLILGDNITTDHISPAGAIGAKSAAGKYLVDHGVTVAEFNQYGTRRGNDEVMTRGTFANPRIKNLMVPGVEGSVTKIQPQGTVASVFDASVAYKAAGVPLVVLAGKNYGSGSSRDWAAKGTKLLGVRAVVAESYERIHRSNLIGMGVLPLQFPAGTNASTLGLTGEETFALPSLSDALKAGATVPFEIRRATGPPQAIDLRARVDTPIEVEYLRNGGILDFVLRQRLAKVA